jgi:hypothetical protein
MIGKNAAGRGRQALAADLGHHAAGGEGVFGQAVPPRFVPDALFDQGFQFFVGGAVAQEGQQVQLLVAQQAQAQLAVGGEAGPGYSRRRRVW